MNLLLSLFATAAVVSAVVLNTKGLSKSAAIEARNVEVISHHATMRLIARLAGYLVSNSIVLCKEPVGGSSWLGHGERRCRWTPRVPSGFINGHAQFYGLSDVSDNVKLSYRISPSDLPFNETLGNIGDIYYKLTFDLVPYREYSSLQKLLKEAEPPDCHSSKAPFDPKEGTCDDPADTLFTCKDKNTPNTRVKDSVCHYDKDGMFVLVEISYHNSQNDELMEKIFAGLKRPSTHTVLTFSKDIPAVCQWSCSSNVTTTEYASCRGEWRYDSFYDDTDPPFIKIINKGPGAVYRVLFKKNTADENDVDVFGAQVPVREVLMPGEEMEFQPPNEMNFCQFIASLSKSLDQAVEAGESNVCPQGYTSVEYTAYVEPARLHYPLSLLNKSTLENTHANYNINGVDLDINNHINYNINGIDMDIQKIHFTINPTRDYFKLTSEMKMGKNSKKLCYPLLVNK